MNATVEHRLVDDTLTVEREEGRDPYILARCICGWRSRHFTGFAASAAFQDHKDEEKFRER